MRTEFALLSLLALLSISTQPALAARFSIIAYDKDNNNALIPDADIEIWQDGNLLDNGKTDGDGVFVTYLNYGSNYLIKAKKTFYKEAIKELTAESSNEDKIPMFLSKQ